MKYTCPAILYRCFILAELRPFLMRCRCTLLSYLYSSPRKTAGRGEALGRNPRSCGEALMVMLITPGGDIPLRPSGTLIAPTGKSGPSP